MGSYILALCIILPYVAVAVAYRCARRVRVRCRTLVLITCVGLPAGYAFGYYWVLDPVAPSLEGLLIPVLMGQVWLLCHELSMIAIRPPGYFSFKGRLAKLHWLLSVAIIGLLLWSLPQIYMSSIRRAAELTRDVKKIERYWVLGRLQIYDDLSRTIAYNPSTSPEIRQELLNLYANNSYVLLGLGSNPNASPEMQDTVYRLIIKDCKDGAFLHLLAASWIDKSRIREMIAVLQKPSCRPDHKALSQLKADLKYNPHYDAELQEEMLTAFPD